MLGKRVGIKDFCCWRTNIEWVKARCPNKYNDYRNSLWIYPANEDYIVVDNGLDKYSQEDLCLIENKNGDLFLFETEGLYEI